MLDRYENAPLHSLAYPQYEYTGGNKITFFSFLIAARNVYVANQGKSQQNVVIIII